MFNEREREKDGEREREKNGVFDLNRNS